MLLDAWAYEQCRKGLVIKLETVRKTRFPTAARIWQRYEYGGLDFVSIPPNTPNHVFGIHEYSVFLREFPNWKVKDIFSKYKGLLVFRAYNPLDLVTYPDGQCQFIRCKAVDEYTCSQVLAMQWGMSEDDE